MNVRDITAQAGFSIALVNRYFGSKEKLFEESLADMLMPWRILELRRQDFGNAMADLLLGGANMEEVPLAMVMLASGDAGARAIAHRLLIDAVYEPLSKWLGAEDGRLRAARLMIISAGFVLYSEIYGLDVMKPEPMREMREWLVQELQRLVE